MDSEPTTIGQYRLNQLMRNSVVTIVGRDTNPGAIHKRFKYMCLFKKAEEISELLRGLPPGEFLVFDETAPSSRIQDVLYRFVP
jgi:hypothetical protein